MPLIIQINFVQEGIHRHNRKNLQHLLCIAERLDFNTSFFIENLFLSANIENRDYKLVFICCKDSVALSYLATAFDKYKSQIPEFKNTTMKTYLERHLKKREAEEGPEEVAMSMVVSE